MWKNTLWLSCSEKLLEFVVTPQIINFVKDIFCILGKKTCKNTQKTLDKCLTMRHNNGVRVDNENDYETLRKTTRWHYTEVLRTRVCTPVRCCLQRHSSNNPIKMEIIPESC